MSFIIFSSFLFFVIPKHGVPLLGGDTSFDELALTSVEHGESVLDEHPRLPQGCTFAIFLGSKWNFHLMDFASEGGTTSDDGFVHVLNVLDFEKDCKDYSSKTYDQ